MPIRGNRGEVYVDRGDPSAWDYGIAALTADGGWHDLDLSAIVTDENATLVYLKGYCKDGSTGKSFAFRQNGRAQTVNSFIFRTQAANVYQDGNGFVLMDSDRVIEYQISSDMDAIGLVVRGWFKPG